jgi:hypothetical protein
MTKEQLVEKLIDIDVEYWNNDAAGDPMLPADLPPFTRRDAEVGILRYQYIAEQLLPVIKQLTDLAESRGYENACKTLVWNPQDPSLWK